VHKETDRLQSELEATEAKLTATAASRRQTQELLDNVQQDLCVVLLERDRAVRERAELMERRCHQAQHSLEVQARWEEAVSQAEASLSELHESRRQTDAVRIELYQTRQALEASVGRAERCAQEAASARRRAARLERRAEAAERETELAQRRRDWALTERGRVVSERESVR
ncbi:uncharacterized protein LOC144954964, partial [Lampetra fluviatilis]